MVSSVKRDPEAQIKASYIKEVKLISCASDRGSKEEGITLQPRDLHGRILESDSGARHVAIG